MEKFDVVVVGCGGVGSSALYQLSKLGLKVAGIDQFSPPHNLGSTHGQTRVIRKAYFEHPDYVPLLERSYDLWRELESDASTKLLIQSGVLEVGPSDGILIRGVKQSASQHNLDIEFPSRHDALSRFRGVEIPEGFEVAYEKEGGYLLVEKCVEAYLSLAKASNAKVFSNTKVLDWKASHSGIKLKTSNGNIESGAMIIAGGPWASTMLGRIHGLHLSLVRKYMYWYLNTDQRYMATSGFPVFAFELPDKNTNRLYYGFPQLGAEGVKVAEHTRGVTIDKPEYNASEFDPYQKETGDFLSRYLPGVSDSLVSAQSCIYTMSHDENFYIDVHPEYGNVAFAAGLSGHGFKFTPVLGEILTNLATDDTPVSKFEFLKARPDQRV